MYYKNNYFFQYIFPLNVIKMLSLMLMIPYQLNGEPNERRNVYIG